MNTQAGRLDSRLKMVLDTWFSSWLRPISVFWYGGISTGKANEELNITILPNDFGDCSGDVFILGGSNDHCGAMNTRAKSLLRMSIWQEFVTRINWAEKCSNPYGNSPDTWPWFKPQYGADGKFPYGKCFFSSPAGNDSCLYDDKAASIGKKLLQIKLEWPFRLVLQGWGIDPIWTVRQIEPASHGLKVDSTGP